MVDKEHTRTKKICFQTSFQTKKKKEYKVQAETKVLLGVFISVVTKFKQKLADFVSALTKFKQKLF